MVNNTLPWQSVESYRCSEFWTDGRIVHGESEEVVTYLYHDWIVVYSEVIPRERQFLRYSTHVWQNLISQPEWLSHACWDIP